MKVSKYKLLPLLLLVGGLTACGGSAKYTANLEIGGKGADEGYVYVPATNTGTKTQDYSNAPASYPASYMEAAPADGEIIENPFVEPSVEKCTSNISLTSSSFAYTTIREEINRGYSYNLKSLVKTEEMLNYFSYGYVNDTDDALTAHLELGECPWNNEHYIASVVVKAKPAITENVKNNIVILVDKSGSMRNIFDLVKTSLRTLIANLGDDDTVSIVSYASGCKVEIEGKTGKDKSQLNDVVDSLVASGSTYGEAGIEKAYETAYKYMIPDGNNRVVILTDGDFNVGKVRGDELTELIKQKASDGVYLTCVGYRSYNNDTLYTLSNNGNGNAYYVDCELEAKKVFEEELGKSMYVVAKDAKCQIEFSDAVSSYRLLGYETRQMSDKEFNDTKKDAGEIMSDHTTIALYELTLKEEFNSDFIYKTTLHYKDPINEENKEVVNVKTDISIIRDVDFDFASNVAEFALIISDSQYKGISSFAHLLENIKNESINDKYRDDFVALVRKSQELFAK